jgi:hypothetical protein
MNKLVRLRIRPSRDKESFRYMLDYVDHDGRRRQISLGHADKRQAERQRQEKELELRVNVVGYASMRLTDFFRDSLMRTKGQVRASTLGEAARATRDFVECVVPSLPCHYSSFFATTDLSVPVQRVDTVSLAVPLLVPFSYHRCHRFPQFNVRAQIKLTPPLCRTPPGQLAGLRQTCPGVLSTPSFDAI